MKSKSESAQHTPHELKTDAGWYRTAMELKAQRDELLAAARRAVILTEHLHLCPLSDPQRVATCDCHVGPLQAAIAKASEEAR